jgi:hypothetical protein
VKELYCDDKDWFRVLCDENASSYVIEVECGGIAVYTVCIQLTAEEVALFTKDKEAMRGLAAQIRKRPNQFGDRTVKCNESGGSTDSR